MKTNGSYACEVCPGGTHVIDSRYLKEEDTYKRRRRCDRCGHRFSTKEIRSDRLESLLRAERFLTLIKKTLQGDA